MNFAKRILRNWFVLNLILTGFIAGFVLSFSIFGVGCSKDNSSSANLSFASSKLDLSKYPDEVKLAYSVQKALNYVAEVVTPAVVNIKSEEVVVRKYRDPFFDFFENDEFFRRFFDIPKGSGEKEFKQVIPSLGSGFIISKDGYILSNLHVVRPAGKIATNIIVTILKSGKQYKARVIGYDEETDIAILKIDPKEDLPTVILGDSDSVKVGDFAIAVGNPFGLNGTFTFGTVSAVGRSLEDASKFSRYIQTDAPINPGNSGGPLVNILGEVIGINTMIYSPGAQMGLAGNVGVGFAIPINLAKNIVNQILTKGKVERGFIGVSISGEPDEITRKNLGIPEGVGVIVGKVEKNSPAEKAGIKPGDIIIEADGKVIKNFDDLLLTVSSKSPGQKIKIILVRDGKKLEFSVEVADRSKFISMLQENVESRSTEDTFEFNGLVVSGSKDGEGVVVVDIKPNSPFEEVLTKGDIILEINRTKISNISDFKNFADKNKNTKEFFVKIKRGEMVIYKGFRIR